MGYRWKPTASQKAEYREKCLERDTLPIKTTPFAIRVGCILKFYSLNKGEVLEGEVINSSYGSDKGQHTFTILTSEGEKILVKGRNLYPNIIEHIQGIESKQQS